MSTVPLKDLAEFTNGFAFKPSHWENDGLRIIRIQNLTDNKKAYNRTKGKFPDKYKVSKGDVLVSWSATLDVFEWQIDEEAWLNQHIFKVSFNEEKVDKTYFKYALKSSIEKMKQFTHGSTMKHIVREDFLKHRIPLPTINKQREIVSLLYEAETLMQRRKHAIDLLDEYLKSIFLEMFGNPVTNPKGWEIKSLGEILDFMTSGSRGWAKYYSNEGSMFLTIKNVSRTGKLLLDNVTSVHPPDNAEARRTRVRNGDVLLSITADLGRTAVVENIPADAYINQHLVILRLQKGYQPCYISSYLSSSGGQLQIQRKDKGASKAGLNFDDIKSIQILVPPIDLQNKFKEVVDQTEETKKKMMKQSDELDLLFNSLLQQSFQ